MTYDHVRHPTEKPDYHAPQNGYSGTSDGNPKLSGWLFVPALFVS